MSAFRCFQLLLLLLVHVCTMSSVSALQLNPFHRYCVNNGQYCQTHRECCSGKCMTYLNQCTPTMERKQLDIRNGVEYAGLPIDVYGQDVRTEGMQIVTSKPTDTTRAAKKMVDDKIHEYSYYITLQPELTCKPVGQFCTYGRDCCTSRCHSYLHKCVT